MYSEYLKFLEEELQRQREILEQEKGKAITQARKILGARGVLPTGTGALELGRIEEAYLKSLSDLMARFAEQRIRLKTAEEEEKKRRLAQLITGGLTLAGTLAGLLIPGVGPALGAGLGTGLGSLTGQLITNPDEKPLSLNYEFGIPDRQTEFLLKVLQSMSLQNQSLEPKKSSEPTKEITKKQKSTDWLKEYAPFLLPALGQALGGLITTLLGLPGGEQALALGTAQLTQFPVTKEQLELYRLQKELLKKYLSQ